jgi:hypothetical protein
MSLSAAGVESIYAKRITTSGTVEYFVKWKGFPAAQNTWETRGDLTGRGIAHSAHVPSSAIRTIATVRDVVAAPGTPGSSRRGGFASRSSSSPATRAATGASASAASEAQFERVERMIASFEMEEAQRRKRAESEEDPDAGGSSLSASIAAAAAPAAVADDRRSPLTIHRPRRLKKTPLLPSSGGGARGSSSPPKTPSPLSGGEDGVTKSAPKGESKALSPADSEGDDDVPLAQYAALLRRRRMPKPEAAVGDAAGAAAGDAPRDAERCLVGDAGAGAGGDAHADAEADAEGSAEGGAVPCSGSSLAQRPRPTLLRSPTSAFSSRQSPSRSPRNVNIAVDISIDSSPRIGGGGAAAPLRPPAAGWPRSGGAASGHVMISPIQARAPKPIVPHAAAAASVYTSTRAPPLSAQQQQQHYQHHSYQSFQSGGECSVMYHYILRESLLTI